MALTINTNISSLNAQRNLSRSQNDLARSMERLSSGLRINSAKDDAAGLAISDRMTAQIRGLNQAARNANDGISMSQTAEGALQESTNMLQRMRELAVQSANDTNSASDRASLDAEIIQLKAEINRIALTTEFNGRRILDGTMTDATFQVGANAGADQTISFSIDSALTADLGENAVTGDPEVPNIQSSVIFQGLVTFSAVADGVAGDGVAISYASGGAVPTITVDTAAGTIDITGDLAAFTTADLATLVAGDADASSLVTVAGGDGTLAIAATVTTNGGQDFIASTETGTRTIDLISVATRVEATITIGSVDAALEDVDTIRAGLGAVQNRFESTIANLNNVSENLSAARSRIQDADIALETAAMTKASILQQAGVAILAQANQTPQLALSLLQG